MPSKSRHPTAISRHIDFELPSRRGCAHRSDKMKTPTALICVCFLLFNLWSEAQEKRSSFPMWAFCVAYQIRDADHREKRPIDPNEEKDPFNPGDTWIPRSVLKSQNIRQNVSGEGT